MQIENESRWLHISNSECIDKTVNWLKWMRNSFSLFCMCRCVFRSVFRYIFFLIKTMKFVHEQQKNLDIITYIRKHIYIHHTLLLMLSCSSSCYPSNYMQRVSNFWRFLSIGLQTKWLHHAQTIIIIIHTCWSIVIDNSPNRIQLIRPFGLNGFYLYFFFLLLRLWYWRALSSKYF